MRIFIHKRTRIIFWLGLLGLVVIWQVYGTIIIERSTADLPDYSRILDSNANWDQYQKLNLKVAALRNGWFQKNNTASEQRIAEFEQKISGESLTAQTAQIRLIFFEEKSFRENELNESIKLYQTKLYQELELEIAVKTASLKSIYDKEVNSKELEVRNALGKYNQDLAKEYQLTFTNLHLQLLLVDLSNSQKDPVVEKKRIQSQIDKIHREMYDKISIRQRQLFAEFDDFKKQRKTVLNLELGKLRNQLEASAAEELRKYRQALEQGFQNWIEQRKQETETAIDLRQNKK
jgi:hypothetical protein